MPERTLPSLSETSVETFPRNVLIREKAGSGYEPTTYAEMRILVDRFKDIVHPQDRTIIGRLGETP